jgi:hypothetical protein
VCLDWIDWIPVLVTVQQRSLWIPLLATLSLLVLVAAHLKLRSFAQLCAWSILSLEPKPPLAYYPAFIVCLATTLFKKQFHKWKNSLLRCLRTFTCPGFFLEIKTDRYSARSSPSPGNVLSRGNPKVYSSTLRLLP